MQPLRVQGMPYERGGQIGQAFAESAAQSVAFNRRYLAARGVSRTSLEHLLAPYLEASTAGMPHLVEQIRGIADGAELEFLDIFFANAFEEIYGIVELGTQQGAALERCTDVLLRSSSGTLLGHNEQWYAGDDGAVGLLLDVSDDGPSVLAPVVAGTLPLVGINELGGAFGTMSLSATDERVGIPRALVARNLLAADSPDEAFRRATHPTRAGGYSYASAFPGDLTCVIETTATTEARLDVTEHTNHAMDAAVAEASCDPTSGSRSRLARARELARSTEATLEGMVALLADHSGQGQDICVHPDPAEGDDGATILFAMICEPDTRSMWLASGHPCTVAVERFGFDE